MTSRGARKRKVIQLQDDTPQSPVLASKKPSPTTVSGTQDSAMTDADTLPEPAQHEMDHKHTDKEKESKGREFKEGDSMQIEEDEAYAKELMRIEEQQARLNDQRRQQQQALAERLKRRHAERSSVSTAHPSSFTPQVQLTQLEGKDLWPFFTNTDVKVYGVRPLSKASWFEVAFMDISDQSSFVRVKPSSTTVINGGSSGTDADADTDDDKKEKKEKKEQPITPSAPKLPSRSLAAYLQNVKAAPTMGAKANSGKDAKGQKVHDEFDLSQSTRIWLKQCDRLQREEGSGRL